MASTNIIPGQQTFNTAYPFDVKIQNQLNGEDLAVLYIVDSVNANEAAQQVQVSINQTDGQSYTIKGFGPTTPFTPGADQFNLAVVIRPGTLRAEVLAAFSAILQTALSAAVSSNICVVNGPVTRPSDGALIWYCAFQNDIAVAPSGDGSPWTLNFTLNGVSAAAGVGSRSTQVEFQFGNVSLNNAGSPLLFTRSRHVDIINHQGHIYAPLYFGVKGNDTLLLEQGYPNKLGVYFETIERVLVQFGEDTEIIFSFPYASSPANGQSDTMHFGENDEVKAYNLDEPSRDVFSGFGNSGVDNNAGLIEFTAKFPSTGQIPNPEWNNINNQKIAESKKASESMVIIPKATEYFNGQTPTYIQICINNLSNQNVSGYSIYKMAVNVDKMVNPMSALMSIENGFSVPSWISAYNSFVSGYSGMYWPSDAITDSPANNMACNTPDAWSDSKFVDYVTNNFSLLINKAGADYNLYDSINQNYVTPSQSLYDFFYGMYQIQSVILPCLINTGNFSASTWLTAVQNASSYIKKTNAQLNLSDSAVGVNSNYDESISWMNADFTNYVTQNFTTLCNQVAPINYLSFQGNNYVAPCQSLYDYFWASFQVSLLTNQLNNTPQQINTYQNLVSYLFNFSNVQVSGKDGVVMLGVSIRNLPGYWDTYFQVPVMKEISTLNAELELGNASTQGRTAIPTKEPNYGNNNFGSRIDFLSGGSTNNASNVSIEEYYGLNLYGTKPQLGTVGPAGVPTQTGTKASAGQPVKIRQADLLVVDGRLGIGNVNVQTGDITGDFTNPGDASGGVNTNEKLRVNGDSYFSGHLGVVGDVGIKGDYTINGNSQVNGQVNIGQSPGINNVALTVSNGFFATTYNTQNLPNPTVYGGLAVGWNKSGGNAEVNFYNVFSSNPTTSFQFSQLKNNTKVDLMTIQGNGDIQINSGRIQDKTGPVMPVGSIIAYAGQTPPAGWLMCDGSTIPSQYTDLINLIGNNTPDLRSRFVVGAGNGNGLSSYGLKQIGGEEQHTLVMEEMPSHQHFGWGEIYDGNGFVDLGFGHSKDSTYRGSGDSDNNNCLYGTSFTGGQINDQINTSNNSVTGAQQGTTSPHNNIPPYYAVNYIIKC